MIELSLVLVAILVLIGVTVAFAAGMARAAKRAQVAGQTAQEIAQLAQATKKLLDKPDATTYPLDTPVAISMATLIGKGFLPADFGRRAGASQPAMTPLGQPYLVVARTIKTGDKPTAIVIETGSAMGEKLPPLGIENEDAPIYGLKQDIAQRVSQDYQVIAGTVITGQRVAKGVADGFTKDLTGYLAADVAQSVAVAFVNFPDLDPAGNSGTNPEDLIPPKKVYESCSYEKVILNLGETSINWMDSRVAGSMCYQLRTDDCPTGPGDHFESVTPFVSNCAGAKITVMPFGALTNGWTNWEQIVKDGADNCPGGIPGCTEGWQTGTVTMNQVTLAQGSCKQWTYRNKVRQETVYPWQAVGVCCRYRWDKPRACTP